MKKLETIQTRDNLNAIYRTGERGPGGAYHDYVVSGDDVVVGAIMFQKGPRNDPNSRYGILDCDLLEIVRDRLRGFQAGPCFCDENARALMYVEQALIQMNMRVEDRRNRGVLGTMEK